MLEFFVNIFGWFQILFWYLSFFFAYRNLRFFLFRRRSKSPLQLMKGAEPIFLKGGKKAVLLFHGFTLTPHALKKLATYLHKKGFTVYAPLLPGHGTSPEHLAVVKWHQYIAEGKRAVATLEKMSSEITLIGHSLGGNIAMSIAQESKKVKRVICLGTPFIFRHYKRRRMLLSLLYNFKIFQKKEYAHRVRKLIKGDVAYDVIPLRSIYATLKLIQDAKKKAATLKKPLLFIQAKDDEVCDDENLTFIEQTVQSKKKRIIVVHPSYHNLLIDRKKTIIFREIAKFMKETR